MGKKKEYKQAYTELSEKVARLLVENLDEYYSPRELLNKWDEIRTPTDKMVYNRIN